MLKNYALAALGILCAALSVRADEVDADGRPVMYIRGEMTESWGCREQYRMTRQGDVYSITLPSLHGEFKLSSSEWKFNYGAATSQIFEIDDAVTFEGASDGGNLKACNLKDVTIRFETGPEFQSRNYIYISANGHDAPSKPAVSGVSGTLPVLYINVYEEDGVTYNNEITDRNLGHKNYFAGKYWLDTNGCEWLEALGATSIGSEDAPLDLQIKARGNFTRKGFSKKPFKLKLDKKQSLLGLSKSKHFAILAHADDTFGYLRNFTGFNLGRRIGLPWTPWQQPVEVVINGDYRGLYFLTESIRVDADRVNITELDDLESDGSLISGGYIVELDNYDEDNQIRMEEKFCAGELHDMLRVTWDTPEEYSDLQKRFITEQFTAMNDFVGANSDQLWSYIDIDDAARYYLVEEIISHVEAYHGSTYLFRDRGEGQKWHYSPLWDCGNAFNGNTGKFIYDDSSYGMTWIASMRCNDKFNRKVMDTWAWFMTSCYDGVIEDIDEYAAHISEAAKADRRRWANEPKPDGDDTFPVVDNSDMQGARNRAVNHLNGKIDWLRQQFGDYTAMGIVAEPARDNTAAAELPEYARPYDPSSVAELVESGFDLSDAVFYNLQGMRVPEPVHGEIYIAVSGDKARRIVY